MHRLTSALATAILGTALTAASLSAQEVGATGAGRGAVADGTAPAASRRPTRSGPGRPSDGAVTRVGAAPSAPVGGRAPLQRTLGTLPDLPRRSDASPEPLRASRGPRYLVRHGWDYIRYQEYERALGFFYEAKQRQNELTDAERVDLQTGFESAERGLRAVIAGTASSRRRTRGGPGRTSDGAVTRVGAAPPAPVGGRALLQRTRGTLPDLPPLPGDHVPTVGMASTWVVAPGPQTAGVAPLVPPGLLPVPEMATVPTTDRNTLPCLPGTLPRPPSAPPLVPPRATTPAPRPTSPVAPIPGRIEKAPPAWLPPYLQRQIDEITERNDAGPRRRAAFPPRAAPLGTGVRPEPEGVRPIVR